MQPTDRLPASLSRRRLLSVAVASTAFTLLGCGGGGGGGGVAGVGSGGTGSFSSGTIRGFGSVIVNGVRYDDSAASIVGDAGSAGSSSELRLGMVVDVTGSDISTDSVGVRRATASSIRLRSEIEGPVSAINAGAGTFTVLGQQVRVAADTVFDDDLRGGLTSLVVGQIVEVYGLYVTSGEYIATRIDDEDDLPSRYKLRGVVSALNTTARTFRIGTADVFYGDVASEVANLADGQYARIELLTAPNGAGQWVASRIQTASTGNVLPTTGRVNAELEGYITAFTSTQLFSVNGVVVDASSATGIPAGLAVGRRVEVKGVLANGQLTASEVELEDDDDGGDDDGFEVEGAISSLDNANQTFVVRGVLVNYADARFEDGNAAQLAVGVRVDVTGQLSADGSTLLAQEVEFDN